MKAYFNLFSIAFIIDLLGTPISLTLGHTHISGVFFHFFKIPFVLTFLVILTFSLRYGIKKNIVTYLFLLIFPMFFFIGLYSNEISKASFSHFYGFLMPILASSFGQFFAQHADKEDLEQFFSRMKKAFKWFFVIISLYFMLYMVGIVKYLGMSSMSNYYTAYFLMIGDLKLTFLSLIAAILTGKRTVLILCFVIVVIFYFFKKKGRGSRLLKYSKTAFMVLGVAVLLTIAFKLGLLNRFDSLLTLDLSDERSMYVASGGRVFEIATIWSHIENSDLFLTGGGMGETYIIPFCMNNLDETRVLHYSHMSPLYLTLVYGIPFSLITYSYLFYYFVISLNKFSSNFFFLVFSSLLLASFSGSILFVDVKFWIFLGVVIGINKYKYSECRL